MAKHNALAHDSTDAVAVVIVDISTGSEVSAVTLEGEPHTVVTATQDIPLVARLVKQRKTSPQVNMYIHKTSKVKGGHNGFTTYRIPSSERQSRCAQLRTHHPD